MLAALLLETEEERPLRLSLLTPLCEGSAEAVVSLPIPRVPLPPPDSVASLVETRALTSAALASVSMERAVEAEVALKKEAFLDTTLLVGSFCALPLLVLLPAPEASSLVASEPPAD